MQLLALDLATNTGACWGDGSVKPSLASFRLAATGDDVGRFLCEFEDRLRAMLDEVCPERIVFEAPVLPRPKLNRSTQQIEGGVRLVTTRKLQGLAGVTEMIAHREGLACNEVQPAEVKQALAGKGNAKKHEMVAAARALGLAPKTYTHEGQEASDEADALGVWLCAVRRLQPQFSAAWTPLFSGRAA